MTPYSENFYAENNQVVEEENSIFEKENHQH